MTGKTALVCDDDRMMTRISKLLLTQCGFTVLEAGDGETGLAMIREHRPNLVLLDLQMPGKSGIDVLHELKADGYTGSYIIVLSADDKTALEATVTPLGAHEAMTKPFAPAEFGRRLATLLKDGRI